MLKVLYVDGKGVANTAICDQCATPITDEERSASVLVHKVPLEPVAGKYLAEVCLLHGQCTCSFIDGHNSPPGRWLLAYFSDWGEDGIVWRDVDMKLVYEALAEVAS